MHAVGRHDCRPRSCQGTTLLEVLVVISIIGLLVSLTAPAILQARSSARRVTCLNNFRQVGVALGGFESTFGRYPNAFCGIVNFPQEKFTPWCISGFAQISSFLGTGPEAGAIHGAKTPTSWDASGLSLDSPPVLHCPEDGLATSRSLSYRLNRGLLPIWPGDPHGVFTSYVGRRAGDVIDGLSNTAFVSERVIGTSMRDDGSRDPIQIMTEDGVLLASECAATQASGSVGNAGIGEPWGTNWLTGDWGQVCYYHFFVPNFGGRDCRGNGSTGPHLPNARSYHLGGVHLLFGDARCEFVSENVDARIWRSWGSRDGWEVAP
jgi:prepilin-type N-terminal cleavage/methylation domain-containing protein